MGMEWHSKAVDGVGDQVVGRFGVIYRPVVKLFTDLYLCSRLVHENYAAYLLSDSIINRSI